MRRSADETGRTERALLSRAALNLAINRRRRVKLWRFVGLAAAENERPLDGHGDALAPPPIREAIDKLPDDLKHVLLLTEMAGMTYAEVAMTLQIREGTVGSRRTRALAILRRQFDPPPGGVEAFRRQLEGRASPRRGLPSTRNRSRLPKSRVPSGKCEFTRSGATESEQLKPPVRMSAHRRARPKLRPG
jgi:hypothetical protein